MIYMYLYCVDSIHIMVCTLHHEPSNMQEQKLMLLVQGIHVSLILASNIEIVEIINTSTCVYTGL